MYVQLQEEIAGRIEIIKRRFKEEEIPLYGHVFLVQMIQKNSLLLVSVFI
jgi:hypothetical protein